MAVYEEDSVVGHVLYNLAPYISHFLARYANKGFAVVMGAKVVSYINFMGLEIPCIYGPKSTSIS